MPYRENLRDPVEQEQLARKHWMHQQRLRDIALGNRKSNLGNEWRSGPNRSMPFYPHLNDNLKKQQTEADRLWAIETENHHLLRKMSALMGGGVDPTEGTREFSPGVRLNRNMVPVIDHGISNPAQEGASLNLSARRRELERITMENRGIVQRIQERQSHYPSRQWPRRSDEHDRHLLLIARPSTSAYTQRQMSPRGAAPSPRPSVPASARRPPSQRGARPGRLRVPPSVTSLLNPVKVGDAHILVALLPGLDRGAEIVLEPQGPNEEVVEAHEVWMRKDGLVVLLAEPCQRAHPDGGHVLVDV